MRSLTTFNHRFPSMIDDFFNDWKQAMLPADGQIIRQSELVTKYYQVRYEKDGTIKYVPMTEKEVKKLEGKSDDS